MATKRQMSIRTAVLKTLAGQYIAIYDVFEQALELNGEFEQEVKEILQEILSSMKNQSQDTGAQESERSLPKQESSAIDTIDSISDESASSSEELPNLATDDVAHPWLKKLFKKIALHCHPDKVGVGEHKKSLFYMKARKALDDKNEPLMLSVGTEFDEYPNIPITNIKKILKDESSALTKKMHEIHTGPAWMWGMSEDNLKIKTQILIHAMAQFYNTTVTEDIVHAHLTKYYNLNSNGTQKRAVGVRPERKIRKNND